MKSVIEISDTQDGEAVETTLGFTPNLENEQLPQDTTVATPSMMLAAYLCHLLTSGEVLELANKYYDDLNTEREKNAS